MTKLTVVEKEGEFIGLSVETAKNIGVDTGQILVITNPFTNRKTVGLMKISPTAPPDTIEVDRIVIESIGLDVGFDVTVDLHMEDLISIEEIEFGIDADPHHPQDNEDALIKVKNHENEMLEFLKDKPFSQDSIFRWRNYGIIISIKKTVPKLEPDMVAKIGELKKFSYGWAGSEIRTFDGVLLLDMSGSMDTQDMLVQDVGWAIEQMRNELTEERSSEFLSRFKEGIRVRRYEGATLCALLYLVEKIGRGVGDNIAVIPFSDRVHPVQFSGNRFYNSGIGETNDAAEGIVDKIENMHHGLTNLTSALEEAIEISKGFDKRRVKMVVLLTDGKADDEDTVLKVMNERIAPRTDIVMNVLGLGTRVNTNFLENIANMTGGSYDAVSGLRELTTIYGRYALDISVSGSDNVVSHFTGSLTVEKCPGCSEEMNYIDKYSSWYCYECQKYKQDF